MITTTEKEQIIKYLGKHPSRKIIPALNIKNIFNERGTSFSPKSIQNIINGITENVAVETEIIKIIATQKKEEQKLENLKKQVL